MQGAIAGVSRFKSCLLRSQLRGGEEFPPVPFRADRSINSFGFDAFSVGLGFLQLGLTVTPPEKPLNQTAGDDGDNKRPKQLRELRAHFGCLNWARSFADCANL